jgi:hypothetical protein
MDRIIPALQVPTRLWGLAVAADDRRHPDLPLVV